MAFVASKLETDIKKILNSPSVTESVKITEWADAISGWLGSASIPPAASVAKSAIESAVKGALAGLSTAGTALTAIPNAFADGAKALASGGSTPGSSAPPSGPPTINLAGKQSVDECANHISSVATAWIIGGKYTAPSSSPIPWK